MSRNLGALTSWNPVGLFRPVMGQLYFFFPSFKSSKPVRKECNGQYEQPIMMMMMIIIIIIDKINVISN
jgi:hypothetical protein